MDRAPSLPREALGTLCVEDDASDLTDFFDGRVYRHILYGVIQASASGAVDNKSGAAGAFVNAAVG